MEKNISIVPRLTPTDIEAVIASEHYFTAADGDYGAAVKAGLDGGSIPPLTLLTFCVLVTKNGHTVTGESYCSDPVMFDAATGRIWARNQAIEKLWPMAVYAERARLAGA